MMDENRCAPMRGAAAAAVVMAQLGVAEPVACVSVAAVVDS